MNTLTRLALAAALGFGASVALAQSAPAAPVKVAAKTSTKPSASRQQLKSEAAGLALAEKQGKEVFYSPTPAGEAFVQQYREVREDCLVKSLDTERNADIGELARMLRTMSGMYDQAARAATSL